ncbi:MAG TPA: hypothetical protein P5560_12260 [Thermotogota bacterium]|nr:hypothetical protein [Thermotogota bacterium]HRW93715.1 hypothetical protein [Thermotogota bacterium]
MKSWETTSSLKSTQSSVQYNGVIQKVEHEQTPSEGMVFLLLDMVVEKKQAGASVFSWENVFVEDAEGHRFSRHPNDSFLASYDRQRMKGTSLNFGKNEGYVCFEIPEESANGALRLVVLLEQQEHSLEIQ